MSHSKHSPESQTQQLSRSQFGLELRKRAAENWQRFRRKDAVASAPSGYELPQYRSESLDQDAAILANRRPSAFFSSKERAEDYQKKTRKVAPSRAFARQTHRKRHGIKGWINLRSAGIEDDDGVAVGDLMVHGKLSRDRAYECAWSGVFATRKVAHGKLAFVMATENAVLELLGLGWEGMEWLKELIESGIASVAELETELLRLLLETSDSPRHSMAELADYIGRSIPTTRKRLAPLEEDGLTITANFVELGALTLREVAGLALANDKGGVYWWIEARHKWLDDKKELLTGALFARFSSLIEQGYELVAVRRTVNSFHFDDG